MNPMNQIFMNNQMNMFNMQGKNLPINNLNMNMINQIPMNNMMMNNIPVNNMMNNQMFNIDMNNMMNMQIINNNQMMMNNPIQNENLLKKNNDNFIKHNKKKRTIPLILQKNANKKFESITFKVEKGLKPSGRLEKTKIPNIFSSLFTKQKTEIDSNGKIKYLSQNEPLEILHYKFNTNEKEFFTFEKKSLIQGLIFAYKNHYPITISPDMIWLLILQGFSRFMDKYHELVREKFVNFEGQKTLYINRYGIPVNLANDETWDGIIDECVEQIGENIGGETISNLQADFTTTNAATLLASQASIMSAINIILNLKY